MRFIRITVRIALFFAALMLILLVLTLHLFGSVLGDEYIQELGTIRAQEGVLIIERLEDLLADNEINSEIIVSLLNRTANERGLRITLMDTEDLPIVETPGSAPRVPHRRWHEMEIRNRPCEVSGPPGLHVRIPVTFEGRRVATLLVSGHIHSLESRTAFIHGLFAIGLVGLAGIVLLTFYVTAPLRRMRRSMDRVAAGDLEHRVKVKGGDEVAQMGTSFNTMADRIKEMIVGQKELLAGVSHELRSPLARMKVNLELLRGEGVPTSRLDELESEVDSIDGLIEELLVASRLDLGSATLAPVDLLLDDLVEQAWGRVAEEARQRGMNLKRDLAEEAGTIHMDPSLGRRILGNLFENAVRYAARGNVTVSSRRQGAAIEVAVSDEGPGVSEDHRERLFEPFFRADPSRSRKTGASGLGLMIVRRAVEAHGGTVRAENSPGGGLQVTFSLPAR